MPLSTTDRAGCLGQTADRSPFRQAPMTKITYIQPDGERIETEAENGATVMETAIVNGVPGIVAECGGACSCATCHVYVDDQWTDVVGGPSPMEEDMLDFAFEVKPTSRLSCQIKVRDEIDGLVVHVPTRQG
jgi:2Fe-2S ferredoxin